MNHKIIESCVEEKAIVQATGKFFSRTRLDRMDTTMRRHVDEGNVPGLVGLVYHRGHEHAITMGNFGFGSNITMERNTIFRLASMTKPIIAVAAMILVEECRIRLDDAIDRWLPELKDRRVLRSIDSPLDDTVPANRPITLRDLLTFRSGYGEVGFLSPASPLQVAMIKAELPLLTWPLPYTADEFMRRLSNLPLAFQPGERWLYHMSAEILGVLIARITGRRLSTFLRERIFEPLGMTDTDFYVPEQKLNRLPTCYGIDMQPGSADVYGQNSPEPRLIVIDEARRGKYAQHPAFESGGGGLVSTADDLLTFGKMMLNHGSYGGEQILSRPSVELMTTDQITPEQKALSPFFANFWETRGWGLGLSIITKRYDLADVPGRFGWDGAFGTSWYVDPKEQLIGILLTQRRPDVLAIPPVIHDFWTSAYQLI